MNEIKVGEYVRTKKRIMKVIEINKDPITLKPKSIINDKGLLVRVKEITNHSFNKIDLIEIGDIVEIKTGLYSGFMHFIENDDDLIMLEEQSKEFWTIKSILTHEAFKANEYRFEEEE